LAIVFIRTLIVYFSLLIAMRLMGKRQLGEMELSEFVVAALIADLASHPLQDIGIPMLNGLIPIFTLFCLEVIISGVTMKSIKLRGLLYGKPSIIINHGKINQKEMKKNRFTADELTEELRTQSVMDISTIEYAILETNGQLNIVLTPENRPVTASQMNVQTEDTGYTAIVVSDGRVLRSNLRLMGRDENWLKKQLKSAGIDKPGDVFLMMANGADQIYVARKEKQK
jgi:uncharacterized membrane protein YcaP (DUF421 family)